MVHRIAGLGAVDTEILRFLAGHKFEDFESGPTLCADIIGSSPSTVSRHFDRLAAAGFAVESTEHKSGRYRATDLGRRYLAQELTEEEIADVEERVADYIEST